MRQAMQTHAENKETSNDPEIEAMARIQAILAELPDTKEPGEYQTAQQRVIWYFTQKAGLVGRRGRQPAWKGVQVDESD